MFVNDVIIQLQVAQPKPAVGGHLASNLSFTLKSPLLPAGTRPYSSPEAVQGNFAVRFFGRYLYCDRVSKAQGFLLLNFRFLRN